MAPLLLLAAYLAITEVRRLSADFDRQARELANTVVRAVDQDLQQRINGLLLLADMADTDPAHRTLLYAQAQSFLRTYGTHVVFGDAQKQMLFNTRVPLGVALPPLPLFEDQRAVLRLQAGKPVVTDMAIGAVAGVPLVAIAVPVWRDGKAAFVLITAIDIRMFADRLKNVALPEGWTVKLLDSKGGVMARRGPVGSSAGQASNRRFVVPSQISSWSIEVETSSATENAPIFAAAVALALALLGATGAGAVGGMVMSRHLGRSLAALVEVPAPDAATSAILEIARVRRFLDESAQERIGAEAALRSSESRFRQLFQLAPLPLALLQKTGVTVDFNRSFSEVFQYAPAEMVSLDEWRALAYPDHEYRALMVRTWEAAAVEARKTGGAIGPMESRIHCRDGNVRTMMISGISIGNEFLAIFFDVTARKAAEEALLATQAAALEEQRSARVAAHGLLEYAQAARLRAENANASLHELSQAVEQSPDSFLMCDLQGVLEYVNAACLRATGYRRDELIGANVAMLRSENSPKQDMDSIKQRLLIGESWKGEVVSRRKDGSDFVEFAIISPVRHADGHIRRFVEVREDITEKKRLGQELDRHRHHLEELVLSRTVELEAARALADAANEAKSAFLANMSHEIRTPMNAIIGLNYLLRQDKLTAPQNARLTKIDTAAHHLMLILNDILDLSKIEVDRLELEHTDFPLSAVLDDVRTLVSDQARAKGLVLQVHHDGVPMWLRGDPTRVRQAMLNFVGNALKFTEHGTIWLRARLLEESAAGLLIRFEVQDTGIGIAADQLSKLFASFTQADPSTTRKFGGTGLGLAITRRLARLMGGDAGGDSTLGQGSTFWYTVRLQRGQPAGRRTAPERKLDDAAIALSREHAGARVLLAEDNPINREVALELLQRVNLSVDTAENGREALEKIRTNRYDLVLMDVQMPEMDGLIATGAIRAQPEHADLPIIAMTANAFDGDRRACLAAGMDDFVPKPVVPKDLYVTLLRWLSISHRFTPRDDVQDPVVQPAESIATASQAAETSSSSLKGQLEAITGLDVAWGLDIVGGNETQLARFLHRFSDAHIDDMQEVMRYMVQGRMPQAERLTHSLKGVAATLGAHHVAGLTAELEAAWRRLAPLAECQEIAMRCDVEMSRLVSEIATLPRYA